MKGINVLSLFDGMSCGRIALERVGIKVNNYLASEIKKTAIRCSLDNYPTIIHLGDITKINILNLPKIDLLIGGSPCQDFSRLKVEGKGLLGEKSKLFYEYLRILQELKNINPDVKFLLENVRMKKESEKELNKYLGVKGVHINSELVSYQKRPRIYWSNIDNITIPEDKNINFQNYKETDYEILKKYKVNKTPSRLRMWNNGNGRGSNSTGCNNVTNSNKIFCLTRKQDRCPNSGLIEFEDFCRYLTRGELEQAQTVPLGYTKSVSKNQAEDLLGDGWTVDVIAHIFKGLPKKWFNN